MCQAFSAFSGHRTFLSSLFSTWQPVFGGSAFSPTNLIINIKSPVSGVRVLVLRVAFLVHVEHCLRLILRLVSSLHWLMFAVRIQFCEEVYCFSSGEHNTRETLPCYSALFLFSFVSFLIPSIFLSVSSVPWTRIPDQRFFIATGQSSENLCQERQQQKVR